MGADQPVPPEPATGRRWAARGALLAAAVAVAAPLILAGLSSVLLVATGLAALAVIIAGAWLFLSHRGARRILGGVLVVAAAAGVVTLYVMRHFLWIVLLSAGLWLIAAAAARLALRSDSAGMKEREASPARRPYLLMNPRSGGGKVGRFALAERARGMGAEVELLDSRRHADVTALAERAVAEGADLLGVAGGDGTQALVAEVAARHGLPFLVISAGTRNHFALDLGLDRDDPSRCLDALVDGVELRIDLGVVNGRPFVNNASFGAYAAVVQSPGYRADKAETALRQLPDLLLGSSGPRLRAQAGDACIEAPQAVLVSNNPYGTEDLAGLGRRPRLDGGVLGIIGVRVDSARQAAGLLRGAAAEGVAIMSANDVVVTADAAEIPVGVDGEALVMNTPVRCEIRPGALRVRVPRHRPGRTARPSLDWRHVRSLASIARRPHGERV